MAKRMKEKNERNSSKIIFNIFIVIVFLVLVGGVFYLSPNYIREDYLFFLHYCFHLYIHHFSFLM